VCVFLAWDTNLINRHRSAMYFNHGSKLIPKRISLYFGLIRLICLNGHLDASFMKLYESRLNKIESNRSCAIDKFRALSSPIDIRRHYLSIEAGITFDAISRRNYVTKIAKVRLSRLFFSSNHGTNDRRMKAPFQLL